MSWKSDLQKAKNDSGGLPLSVYSPECDKLFILAHATLSLDPASIRAINQNEWGQNMTKKAVLLFAWLTATAISASAQTITAISPDTAVQGTTDLTVTFTLSGSVPAAAATPDRVTIGTLSGTSIAHPSQYTVTAVFDFPFSETTGTKDAVIEFPGPMGTLSITKADGFTVTAGADTAPSITSDPSDVVAAANSSALFSVAASGSSPISYQWQQDLVDLEDGTNSSYRIDSVTDADVGGYRCRVMDDFGSATSAVATLTVYTNSYTQSYLLIDTGQANCYDTNGLAITPPGPGEDYAGQDAQYDSAEMVYQDNGNGIISDLNTGLMWEQVPCETEGLSWDEAVEYCEDLELGGYTDWRMPSCKELFSISDFTSGWPYINTNYFTLAIDDEVSKDEQYWASDYYVGYTVEGQTNAAFGVNHVTGHIKAYAADVSGHFGNYVRAVRGDEYGINEFQDNGDGTITDTATGLMWQQDDDGIGRDWPSALAYAEDLELAGYRDWRLPNIKELQSILDYTHSPTATDTNHLGPAIDTDFFSVSILSNNSYAISINGATTATNLQSNTDPDYGYYWSSSSAYFSQSSPGNYYGWYIAVGTAINDEGADFHGAGAVRFDTMVDGGAAAEEEERVYNYVLCVRGGAEEPDTDSDDDGLSDWYEYNYASSTTNMVATADDDNDGVSNEDEAAAGTVPTDASSIFKITELGDSISWTSELGKSYTLQSSTNLVTGAFANVAAGIATTAPTNIYLLDDADGTVFFRVLVEQ
jgi:hypothetical protein